jgi:hypothetical protein
MTDEERIDLLTEIANTDPDPMERSTAHRMLANLGAPLVGPGTEPMPRPAPKSTQPAERNVLQRLGDAMPDVGEIGRDVASGVNRFVNTATLGGYNAIMDPLSRASGVPLVPNRDERDRFQRENQALSMGIDVGASAVGAPSALGKAVAGPIGAVASRLGRIAGPVAGGGATGAVTGGLTSGSIAAGDGRSVDDVLDAAKSGAMVGGALGTVAGAAQSGQNILRRDAKVDRYLTARDQGKYAADPDLKASNDAQYMQVASKGLQRIARQTNARMDEATARRGLEEARLAMEGGRVDTSKVVQRLREIRDAQILENGEVNNPAVHKLADEYLRKLAPKEVAGAGYLGGYKRGEGGNKASELLSVRKTLRDVADFDGQRTPESGAAREVYEKINDAMPDNVRQSDAAYASEIEPLKRINDIMFGKDKARVLTDAGQVIDDGPVMQGRAVDEKAGILKLARVANDTQPGYASQSHFDEIAKLDPTIGNVLDDVRTADAYRDTRFGLPLDRSMGGITGFIGHNLRALGSRPANSALQGAKVPAQAMSRVPMSITDAYEERKRRAEEIINKYLQEMKQ